MPRRIRKASKVIEYAESAASELEAVHAAILNGVDWRDLARQPKVVAIINQPGKRRIPEEKLPWAQLEENNQALVLQAMGRCLESVEAICQALALEHDVGQALHKL
jgi:hypothetical protein